MSQRLGGEGDKVRDANRQREGTNPVRTKGQKDASRLGGWEAQRRPGGLQIRWEKSPSGQIENVACSGMGTD